MIQPERTTSDFRSIKFFVAASLIQIAYSAAHADGRLDMYAVREIVTVTKTPAEKPQRSDSGHYGSFVDIARYPYSNNPELSKSAQMISPAPEPAQTQAHQERN